MNTNKIIENLTRSQKAAINHKLTAFDKHNITDPRWRAYMLATSFHETAGSMLPVEEFGRGKGKPYGSKVKFNGQQYTTPNKLYWGRGDVQLTWYENYEMMGRLLNIPLLNNPEMALEPDVSANIMVVGMTRGLFTGVSLRNYFNAYRDDPFNARKIVNGLDKARLIEGYYWAFLEFLGG